METKLIYPPFSTSISSPPSSIAALKGYLNSNEITCHTIDMNIQFIDYLLQNLELLEKMTVNKFNNSREDIHSDRKQDLYKLYFYPSILKKIKENPYFEKGFYNELFFKLLFNLVNYYYFEGIFNNNYYLFGNIHQLKDLINNSIDDIFINNFLGTMEFSDHSLIGFSFLCETQLPYGILFANILKTKYKNIKIVAGGPYITEIINSKEAVTFLLHEVFDFLVAYEGESALQDIIHSLEKGLEVTHPNVLYKQRRKELPSFREKTFIENIKKLPVLNFDNFNLQQYLTSDLSLPLYTSKGCTWGRCSFCNLNLNLYREKDIESILSDLKILINHNNSKHIQFVDENISPQRLKALSEAILQSGLHFKWYVQIRFDKNLDYQTLAVMKKAGCYSIEFGLESGSAGVLKKINKGITCELVKNILTPCNELEYEVILNCMIGFPDETLEEANETLAFVEELRNSFPKLRLSCNTQVVKIYVSSKYITRNDLVYTNHPFSAIVQWENPSWVEDFLITNKNHFVFSSKNSFANYNEDKILLVDRQENPKEVCLELSHNCMLLDNIAFDFSIKNFTSNNCSYLLLFDVYGTQQLYMINDTMKLIISLLSEGRRKLLELRTCFVDCYQSFELNDVLLSFKKGILNLNEIGALKW